MSLLLEVLMVEAGFIRRLPDTMLDCTCGGSVGLEQWEDGFCAHCDKCDMMSPFSWSAAEVISRWNQPGA